MAESIRNFYLRITTKLPVEFSIWNDKPQFVTINNEGIERIVSAARTDASAQYIAFVAKLIKKIGDDVVDANLSGSHVWGYSYLTITRASGSKECWKTQQILNVSVLGTVFNQWPTRKVKI
jgi:hypothetical protein